MADQREKIPTAESSAQRLTVLYILALSAVALFTIFGQVLVQRSLAQQRSDSSVVNVAGRQRMLSQQITKLALQIHALDSLAERQHKRQELRETLDLWQTNHRNLQLGSEGAGLLTKNSSQVQRLYVGIEPDFQALLTAGRAVAEPPASPRHQNDSGIAALNTILEREPIFLAGMDRIVKTYDEEAGARVASLEKVTRLLMVITLGVLLLEGLFIFRPAVRQIRRMVQRLRDNAVDLQLAKEVAESANLEKTRFLAKMSHELRTPMNAILGLSEVLLRSRLQPGQRKVIDTIHDSAGSLMGLLTDLLDMSKLEIDTSLQLRIAPFHVKRTLIKVHEMFLHQALQRGLQLSLEVDNALDQTVLGDENRLRQILVNLIQNALKFTEAGEVAIDASVQRTMAHEVWAMVSIRDTGPGIPPEDQKKIFEPFTQSAAHQGKHGGAGLGLSIASRLVETMQGRMRVVSCLGEGTTFVLEIPFGVPFQESAAQDNDDFDRASQEALTTLCGDADILIVEDVAANRLVIGTMLGEWGIVPRYAETLAQAFDEVDRAWPDIIFLDLELPDGNGFQFLEDLHQRCLTAGLPQPRVIALTAHATEEMRGRTEAAGMDQFLAKPLTLDGIRTTMERLYAASAVLSQVGGGEASIGPMEDLYEDPLEDYPPDLRRQLRDIFRESNLAYYEAMMAAWQATDHRQFVFEAHRLLGLVANLGGSPALSLLRELDDDQINLADPALKTKLWKLREDLANLSAEVAREDESLNA